MKCVEDLLNIESPTGSEQNIHAHIKEFLNEFFDDVEFLESNQSLIARSKKFKENCEHVALIGHTDVVPKFFKAYHQDGKLFGSGASDMKGALGVYLELLKNEGQLLFQKYNVSFVFYAKEEDTPMEDNGLYELIQKFPDYFQSIDLAIVGEPTDNQIHIGCVGSLHVKFRIQGTACHSARPWNGKNALYKALPFLKTVSEFQSQKHAIFGVDFFDVIQVTEFKVEPGRTSLPGWVEGNINFRFAPVYEVADAKTYLLKKLKEWGLQESEYQLLDIAPAAKVIENELFKTAIQKLDCKVEAKQAWTDVAQLSLQNISAFNFGPGLTAQAHKENEYILLEDLKSYYQKLKNFFT